MQTIICYGDSNIWGYDPRSVFEDRYEICWCSILEDTLHTPVVNLGMNGRTIPRTRWELDALARQIQQYPEATHILIMLGTNDILHGTAAADAAKAMEDVCTFLAEAFPALLPVILIPPQIRIPEFTDEMSAYAGQLETLAVSRELPFCNLHVQKLSLAWDGVHLTEDGHRQAAEILLSSGVLTLREHPDKAQ